MKIRHGAIVDNVVTNLCSKSDDDWLWNEKALVLTTTRRTAFVELGDPFPDLKSSQRQQSPPGVRNAAHPQRVTWRHRSWPFDSPYAISYRRSTVTESISPTVFKIFGPAQNSPVWDIKSKFQAPLQWGGKGTSIPHTPSSSSSAPQSSRLWQWHSNSTPGASTVWFTHLLLL